MSKLPSFMIKRAIFMLCVMFPVLLYAEYTGNNTVLVAAATGGISSGVSVILFPATENKSDKLEIKNKSDEK